MAEAPPTSLMAPPLLAPPSWPSPSLPSPQAPAPAPAPPASPPSFSASSPSAFPSPPPLLFSSPSSSPSPPSPPSSSLLLLPVLTSSSSFFSLFPFLALSSLSLYFDAACAFALNLFFRCPFFFPVSALFFSFSKRERERERVGTAAHSLASHSRPHWFCSLFFLKRCRVFSFSLRFLSLSRALSLFLKGEREGI